jgi:arylsulfatase A-like enzyme
MTSHQWFNPSKNRWRRIKPIALVYVDEIYNKSKSQLYENGISVLGGKAQAEYPFYQAQNDDSSYAAFRKIPLENKPDIIILVIESLRGWETDIRNSEVCAKIPNLCKFSREAVFFPEAHSVGFPTTEGHIGIQMGLWSHPAKALITHYNILNAISLPEILGKAGYQRAIFTAAEPSFDNMLATFRDWFDYYEYNPENNDDVSIANTFTEYLSKVNRDKPLYITWFSYTTHVPFVLPDGRKGYEEALHYADSAIGMVLDAVEKYRRNETIIVITGDHSYPKATLDAGNLSGIHSGYTHIPLFIKTPNSQGGSVIDKIVSQVDIAPTILSELGLSVSNSFPGHNLFFDSSYPVLAFRYWDCAIYNYEPQECEKAMKSWAWILDNNKLMPP